MHAKFMENFLSMSDDERAHASSDLDRAVAAVRRAQPRHPLPATSAPRSPDLANAETGGGEDSAHLCTAERSATAVPSSLGGPVGGISGTGDNSGVVDPPPSGAGLVALAAPRVGIPDPASAGDDLAGDGPEDDDSASDCDPGVSSVRIADDDDSLSGDQLAGPEFIDPIGGTPAPSADDLAYGAAAPGGDGTARRESGDGRGELPNRTLADMFGENSTPTAIPAMSDSDPYSTAQTPAGRRPRHGVLDDVDDAPGVDNDDDADPGEAEDGTPERDDKKRGDLVGAIGSRAGSVVSGVRTRIDNLDLSFRTKVVGAGVAALVAVLFIGYLAWPSGDEASPSTTPPPQTQKDTGAGETNADGVVLPATRGLEVDCANGSTSPSLAFTNDASQAWQCMRYYSSDNVTLTITFSKPVTISRISFVPGWNYVEPSGVDNWAKWRVVTQVLWVIGNNQYAQAVTPTRSGVEQRISPPVSTTTVQMVIQQTAPSSGNDDKGSILDGGWSKTVDGFAISNIRIYGRESE
jgi:hypothetical protein